MQHDLCFSSLHIAPGGMNDLQTAEQGHLHRPAVCNGFGVIDFEVSGTKGMLPQQRTLGDGVLAGAQLLEVARGLLQPVAEPEKVFTTGIRNFFTAPVDVVYRVW